jgi:hypothetical protein
MSSSLGAAECSRCHFLTKLDDGQQPDRKWREDNAWMERQGELYCFNCSRKKYVTCTRCRKTVLVGQCLTDEEERLRRFELNDSGWVHLKSSLESDYYCKSCAVPALADRVNQLTRAVEHVTLSRRDEGNIFVGTTRVVLLTGETGVVTATPEVVLVPRYLIVPRSIASDFEILGVKTGDHPWLGYEGAIPAAVFSGDVEATALGGVPEPDLPLPVRACACKPGQAISITVCNVCPRPQSFNGVVVGRLVE